MRDNFLVSIGAVHHAPELVLSIRETFHAMLQDDPVLGAVIANYPSDRFRLLFIAGLIGSVPSLIISLTIAQVEEWWGPVLTVLLTASLALPLAWYVLHLWNREVIVFARGFSYREGGRIVYFLFSEIRSLRQRAEQVRYLGLFRRKIYQVTMTTTKDEVIRLTNLYRRIGELSARLDQGIHTALTPLITRRLLDGERVDFSDTLQMSAEGLHESGRDLPWGAFSGYKVERGKLLLLDQSAQIWFSLPLTQVDNLTLLVDFLRQRMGVKSEE
jgi:hypothetical protein